MPERANMRMDAHLSEKERNVTAELRRFSVDTKNI